MSCHDSVNAICRGCGDPVEFQSKAGACEFEVYGTSEVPLVIAEDLCGEIEKCRRCGHLLKLTLPIRRIHMEVD